MRDLVGSLLDLVPSETNSFLIHYSKPDNVHELEHVIERAIALTPHPIITPEDLPEAIRTATIQDGARVRGWETLEEMEKNYIRRVLEAHHLDHGEAAAIFGIHRKTLFRTRYQ